ncbi:hypothetical protein BsIDN1_14490 [Bacillus safensis]|uniref:Uncharacterized protein n=1 Tax=Bacillus safensis TaxID=561879 RepID=A0A5S9M4F6_BACIA|nr:hypothetical protein BsIDN1_14490 [Bacillus safensis]
MDFAQRLSEERIKKKAMDNGAFEGLSGFGKPLPKKMMLLMYQKNLEWATAS